MRHLASDLNMQEDMLQISRLKKDLRGTRASFRPYVVEGTGCCASPTHVRWSPSELISTQSSFHDDGTIKSSSASFDGYLVPSIFDRQVCFPSKTLVFYCGGCNYATLEGKRINGTQRPGTLGQMARGLDTFRPYSCCLPRAGVIHLCDRSCAFPAHISQWRCYAASALKLVR